MDTQTARVLLGVIDLVEAKRLRSILEDRGVPLYFKADEESCSSSSCAPKVEVYFDPLHSEDVKRFLEEERARTYAGLEIDPKLLEETYDSERAQARCPACGTEFATTLKECPDCGLGFGEM